LFVVVVEIALIANYEKIVVVSWFQKSRAFSGFEAQNLSKFLARTSCATFLRKM
jgi:hypothetical protein